MLFISDVDKILDDFLITDPMDQEALFDQSAKISLTAMLLAFKTLRIPIVSSKTVDPIQVIEFLEIILV